MTPGAFQGPGAALGPRAARPATVAVAVGALALAVGVALGHAQTALGALAATWLFTAGIAAGGVAFSAAVRCSKGRWAQEALPALEAGAGFFPTALALLAVLVLGARMWIPGAAEAGWGSWAFRCARELGGTGLLFAAGTRYLRCSRAQRPSPTAAAIAYLLLYVTVLSMWAIDLVMNLHEWAPSTVIPPFVFIGALLGGVALAALASARDPEAGTRVRADLGKLLFALVIFWGYLVWAAYLPVWYGGLPDETGQLLARWAGGWKIATCGVLVAVLGFPFFFLLPERTKRGRSSLAVVASGILAGLLGERFLLVLPSLDLRADPLAVLIGAGVAVGALGLFVLGFGAKLRANRETGARRSEQAPRPSA